MIVPTIYSDIQWSIISGTLTIPSMRFADHVNATSIFIHFNLTFFTIVLDFQANIERFSIVSQKCWPLIIFHFYSLYHKFSFCNDEAHCCKSTDPDDCSGKQLHPPPIPPPPPPEESHSNYNNPTCNHHSIREQSRTYPWQKRGSRAA